MHLQHKQLQVQTEILVSACLNMRECIRQKTCKIKYGYNIKNAGLHGFLLLSRVLQKVRSGYFIVARIIRTRLWRISCHSKKYRSTLDWYIRPLQYLKISEGFGPLAINFQVLLTDFEGYGSKGLEGLKGLSRLQGFLNPKPPLLLFGTLKGLGLGLRIS